MPRLSALPKGLLEALTNQWRTVKQYIVKETVKVPRTGRTEDDKYSKRNILKKGKIVYVRWDATYPNLIELEYPSKRYSVIFAFTIKQWRVIKPSLCLFERNQDTDAMPVLTYVMEPGVHDDEDDDNDNVDAIPI